MIKISEKLTIRKVFSKYLDDSNLSIFRMVYDGQCYAGTKKRATRVSVIIPKEIAKDNLKFMNEWNFYIIGFEHEKKGKESIEKKKKDVIIKND